MRRLPLLLLCLACKKPAPAQPARFCDQDLSGVWLNATDKHFAYRFRDHGDVVRGEFLERADDGGLSTPPEPMSFEFSRSESAVRGAMRTTQRTPAGRDCPVEFGINLTACHEGSLQAEVEMDAPVDEDCKRKTAEDGGELPTHRTEFVFVKESPHPSGGGDRPDAH